MVDAERLVVVDRACELVDRTTERPVVFLVVAGVRVLATVDEDTYEGAVMGAPHPIAWAHAFEGGRAWYTAMGHTAESYTEPDFLDHLLGGVLWAAALARDSLDAR